MTLTCKLAKALSLKDFLIFPNCKLFSIDFHPFQSLVYQGLPYFSIFLVYIYIVRILEKYTGSQKPTTGGKP